MSHGKPIILMDIDGVILPQDMRPPSFSFVKTVKVGHAWARADVVTWLRNLMNREDVDFRWLTTWGDNANTVLAPTLGLPKATVCGDEENGPGWWKARQAISAAAEGQTVIWVEDAINTWRYLNSERPSLPPNLHVVIPNPKRGLSSAHMTRIDQLIEETQG